MMNRRAERRTLSEIRSATGSPTGIIRKSDPRRLRPCEQGIRKNLLVMATGTGKTDCIQSDRLLSRGRLYYKCLVSRRPDRSGKTGER